jgi:hypothetical protein
MKTNHWFGDPNVVGSLISEAKIARLVQVLTLDV